MFSFYIFICFLITAYKKKNQPIEQLKNENVGKGNIFYHTIHRAVKISDFMQTSRWVKMNDSDFLQQNGKKNKGDPLKLFI